jgi:hypothetical protein
VGLAECRFVQLLHACASALATGFVVFVSESAIRIVVQEITENLLAVGRILHRVEDMVVPENIDVEARRDLLIGEHFQEVQEAAVLDFHRAHL